MLLVVCLPSCDKPTDPDFSSKYDDRGGSFVPTTALTTFKASQVTATEAWSGGNFENTYGPSVTKKGVCWSTSAGPTINTNCTDQGTGHTQFSSKLEPLAPGTAYFIRAYAVHEGGAVVYGNQEQFATLAPPNVTTSAVTQVGTTTATAGGNVTSAGSSAVTARGVCYATTENPTTANSCTSNGIGTGSFATNLTGLSSGTTYYVRAYATNPIGTTYGTQISFTTTTAVVSDIDGNIYPTVKIGDQIWMASNLKTTRYRNAELIPQITDNKLLVGLQTGAWMYWGHNISNNESYGKLYNNAAATDARGVCPVGWHVSTYNEWGVLRNYLGGWLVAAKKLKSMSGWASGYNGTNEVGFSALPGGFLWYNGPYDIIFTGIFSTGHWWGINGNLNAFSISAERLDNNYFSPSSALSVRCVKD